MVTVEYVGPFGEVVVPVLRVTVRAGEPVEVSEATAAALCEQADVWRRVEPVKGGKGGVS